MNERNKQDFPLFSFIAILTLGCIHVFRPHGRMESPQIRYSHQGEDFQSLAHAKASLHASLTVYEELKFLVKLNSFSDDSFKLSNIRIFRS